MIDGAWCRKSERKCNGKSIDRARRYGGRKKRIKKIMGLNSMKIILNTSSNSFYSLYYIKKKISYLIRNIYNINKTFSFFNFRTEIHTILKIYKLLTKFNFFVIEYKIILFACSFFL